MLRRQFIALLRFSYGSSYQRAPPVLTSILCT